METKYTNFDGDWDQPCPHCGEPHRVHQVNMGEHEGVTYIHRQPCEKQKHQISKDAALQGVVVRTAINIYDLCKYIYDKIPFKTEAQLVYSFFKNIFISIRALLYLNRTKPK